MENKILIIGDSCKDVFVYTSSTRLAPDVPVPVLNIIDQTENEGMAMNVFRNVRVIHSKCDIITNPNWESITKTRYVDLASNHLFIRVDSDHSVIPKLDVTTLKFDYDLIAISDYNKGFISESDIEYICKRHPNVFIDTKKQISTWANNAKYIKINNFEYNRSLPTLTEWLKRKIIHTKGGDGCEFCDKLFPTAQSDVKDSSGAGDTFFAGLIVSYSRTGNIEEAISFANKCAGKVVKERGVTTL